MDDNNTLCTKQVESHSNWSDLVRVISDEACLTQGDLFWHYPTKSQMRLGTQALCSSGGVSVPLPRDLVGQAQYCPASFQAPHRASARLAAINWELDLKNLF